VCSTFVLLLCFVFACSVCFQTFLYKAKDEAGQEGTIDRKELVSIGGKDRKELTTREIRQNMRWYSYSSADAEGRRELLERGFLS